MLFVLAIVVAELLRWLGNVTVPDLMLIRQLNYRGHRLLLIYPFIRLVIFSRLNEMIARRLQIIFLK
ncbi:MAG: hypothetical protein CM15mP120_13900 [Pseudomonadota bacterium]|nr:MAG: hypothetical protein CM15mP120_13900 [Pseudomonadota bacterium]